LNFQLKKSIYDYKYCVAFDLAKYETGVAVIDVHQDRLVSYYQISVSPKSETPVLDLYNKINLLFDIIQKNEGSTKITDLQKDVFVLREMMPQ